MSRKWKIGNSYTKTFFISTKWKTSNFWIKLNWELHLKRNIFIKFAFHDRFYNQLKNNNNNDNNNNNKKQTNKQTKTKTTKNYRNIKTHILNTHSFTSVNCLFFKFFKAYRWKKNIENNYYCTFFKCWKGKRKKVIIAFAL